MRARDAADLDQPLIGASGVEAARIKDVILARPHEEREREAAGPALGPRHAVDARREVVLGQKGEEVTHVHLHVELAHVGVLLDAEPAAVGSGGVAELEARRAGAERRECQQRRVGVLVEEHFHLRRLLSTSLAAGERWPATIVAHAQDRGADVLVARQRIQRREQRLWIHAEPFRREYVQQSTCHAIETAIEGCRSVRQAWRRG